MTLISPVTGKKVGCVQHDCDKCGANSARVKALVKAAQKLVKKWRAESEFKLTGTKRSDIMVNGESRAFGKCADELTTSLAAFPDEKDTV